MKKIRYYRHNQLGETIVEVLIAIAILSGVLGLAFASASRSSKNIQANKERYQAVLLANEQASLLKAKADDNGILTDATFCFKNDSNFTVQTNGSPTDYATNCTNRGTPSIYTIKIKARNAPSCYNAGKKTCTYEVIIEWYSVKGGTQLDRVEVFYVV